MNLQHLFAQRIGGTAFGQTGEIYKFEKIKRAKAAARAAHPEREMLDFGVGEPDRMAPRTIRSALKKAVDKPENRGYADNGIPLFREAAARYLRGFFGVEDIDQAREINHTIGSKSALSLLPLAFVDPGDEVLLTVPGYPVLGTHAKYLGGSVVPVPLTARNRFLPDLARLEKRDLSRVKLFYVNYPNNPTGAVYSEKDIKEFGDIAAEFDIPLISDEIYDKIVFDGKFHSASKLKPDVPRIILNGFSKVNLMPGWRMGYCYFMDESGLMDEIRQGMMKQFRARICPNVPCQAAARASLQGPQDYIVEMNKKLKDRADFTNKRLNEIPLLSTRRAKGALYMFPHIDLKGTPWKNDKDFVVDLIKNEGVVLVHGSGFCEEFGVDHFRTILLAPPETLTEAYDKIEKFIQRRI